MNSESEARQLEGWHGGRGFYEPDLIRAQWAAEMAMARKAYYAQSIVNMILADQAEYRRNQLLLLCATR